MAGRTVGEAIDVASDSDDSMEFGGYRTSSDIEEGVEAIRINRHELAPGIGGSSARNTIGSYEICLNEILEVFPDISREHVQQAYNKHMEALGSYQPQVATIAQTLIEKFLDKGAYPKERDRIKELKRKRSQGNHDAEEAARWKYADMRDDPLQYAKVVYVPQSPVLLISQMNFPISVLGWASHPKRVMHLFAIV